jgi:DNA repair protein RecO (recombination protein O)
MHFSTSGLIVHYIRKGDKSALVKIFTPSHGLVSGYVKNIYNKKSKINVCGIGNIVRFHLYSREGGLAIIVIEEQAIGIYSYMDNKTAFNAILSLCSIINGLIIADSDGHKDSIEIYEVIENYIKNIRFDNSKNAIMANLLLTIKEFYRYIGYGFDVSKCVVTSSTNINDLIYLSPKSWRAVSKEVGRPYDHLLYKLPKFFIIGNIEYIQNNECLLNGFSIIFKLFKKINNDLNLKHNDVVINKLLSIQRELSDLACA